MALTKTLGGSGGGGSPAVQEEGVTVTAAASTINFVGSGVTATDVAGVATVTIPGASGAVDVADEGSVVQASASQINFVGAGVTAVSDGAGGATVTVPGTSANVRAYWMVAVDKIQNTAADNARIGELQLRATSGGSNIATGGTPIYIDQFASSGDNSAAAAFDGNTATGWGSQTTARPSGVGYQLASASAVTEIVITSRNDSYGPGGAPTFGRILSSADGVNWSLEWTFIAPATWTAGLARTFTRPA